METTTIGLPLTAPFYGANYGTNGIESQINQLADQVTANDIKGAVRSVGADVTNGTSSVKETVAGVNQNVTAGNYTTLTGLNDLGRDINHTIQREEIAWMNAVNASNIATLTGFTNTNAVLQTGFNQAFVQNKDISAEICKSTADIRTEMLAQHCDIKSLVRDENSKTRDLITSNRILELERQLSDSKSENSNFRQTRDLLNSLVDCRPKAPCPCPTNGNGNGNGNGNS